MRAQRVTLTVAEVAEAAVFGDLALALVVAGFFLPVGTLFIFAAMVPFALLGARHRPRAVLTAGAVATLLSALLLGPGGPQNVALVAGCGAVAGVGLRRGWGVGRVLAAGMVFVWVPVAALTIGYLELFGTARRLLFAQARSVAGGADRVLAVAWPGAHPVRTAVDVLIRHWQPLVAGGEAVVLAALVVLAWLPTRPLLHHLVRALRDPLLPAGDPGAPGPVPARLDRVSVRYPGAHRDALSTASVEVPAAAFVAVLGPNGSGKSTLGAVLAGLPPTGGAVHRPGSPALGRPGGTAIVGQRPESQVLGVLAGDDVRWGVTDPDAVDVGALLARVGLAGFAERETATLSGGQLQRLAVAAALARRPALLISDESTSMLDPAGRAAVMGTLRSLPADGITVVHISHRSGEEEGAALLVWLHAGALSSWAPHR